MRPETEAEAELARLGARARGAADRLVAARGDDELRDARAGVAQALARGRQRRPWLVLVPALALSAVALVAWWALRQPVPARLEPASAWSTVETVQGQAAPLEFSDGTRLLVAERSRVRLVEQGGARARVRLERGSLEAAVRHRTGATWYFEAGPWEVEVTGTRFTLGLSPADGLDLQMTEGEVRVRGPGLEVPRVVRGGERVQLEHPTPPVPPPAPAVDVEAPAPPAPAVDVEAPVEVDAGMRPRTKPRRAAWEAAAAGGNYEMALARAEAEGFSSLCDSLRADELLLLGDTARLGLKPALAEQGYAALRRRFPRSRQASTAAFMLGKVASAAGRHRDAASWFEQYLTEFSDGALAREAMGRLMESSLAAGNQAGARAAARDYLERFPEGPHAPLARSLVPQ